MKIFPIVGPISGTISFGIAAVAVQQSNMNVSVELLISILVLLISILVNVALIALAFGKIQASVSHLKDTADRVEKYMNEDVTRIEKRVEQVASRYHHIANVLVGLKLLRDSELRDKNET